ncbi:MAG: hypothetical protein OXH03_11885 [Bacteroidetes bacterium]|nr:hypothetical protein [Bacteroidota bacterium]MXW82062.1 DUF885 domain-containing protein [Rhodothermaceae bacterium]MDE2671627.1 hypothetical protein [Bacteroidota bacterium]MXX59287.1 DUF885 domain-containing protein [Rhodothermaceae bacterium]MYD20552.1 DUF885 domain-containing protein [Rhodothermaceae bacterium]
MRWQALILILILCGCTGPSNPQPESTIESHEDLVGFFTDWREYVTPNVIDGIPDYSSEAMAKQYAALESWRTQLEYADTTGWPVSEQIDWYLVWIEINGLDFAHRVKQPWRRDPAFYVWFYPSPTDVPEREAPNIHGAIELPKYTQPLSNDDAADLAARLGRAAPLFEQAKINLTGEAHDLWRTGERSIRSQSRALEALAERVQDSHPDLATAALGARNASEDFADWIAERSDTKKGISGVGKENYTWNLRNVHLLPYSWEDQVLLMQRELDRAHSALRLEEHRNRDLPRLTKIQAPEEYDRQFNAAVDEYMAFLREDEILPIKDYIEPALRARVNSFTPSEGLRGFFSEITYRDPLVMRTHDYHWIDLARLREEPHSSVIRQGPLLYNAFDSRAEGMATGMEEMMMHAGLFDDKPSTRELIWILLAQRAARGLGGLYQHGHEMSLDEAATFASNWTPWDLLPADGNTIQGEEQFYLRQPSYGTSYVIGKLVVERLIAEYARQRDGEFVLSEFMDEFNASGIIPMSLIYWEMTGDRSLLDQALSGE